MIVTLTLNPSLDRTLEVDRLRRGGVNRAGAVRIDPGGKGVNVTRALRAFGVQSRAVLPYGGPDGQELVRMLAEADVPIARVPVAGWTRSNVTVVEPGGTSTKINAPGDPLTEAELAALADTMLRACSLGERGVDGVEHDSRPEASWVVLCGSLPPGVPDGVYASLTSLFTARGIRVAVDTSGAALAATVAAGPDLIKPNREELAAAVGSPLSSIKDVVAAAEQLRARGAGAVLASLGSDGAVLVDAGGAVLCTADPVEPSSTVGAGDALLAGFLAAGAEGDEAVIEAVAWGRAAVGLPGSRMPGPEDIDRDSVRIVRDPDGVPEHAALSSPEG
jgi:1-phosphofructokinase